mgnify:CR=1 FL=1|jgi:AraC family transcriptional activator of tynA and feaB
MQALHSLSQGRAGYEQWQHDVRAICGRFESRAPESLDDFYGRIALNRLPGLEFADVATNAQSLAKSGHDTRAEDGCYYFLIYQQGGASVLAQKGQQALLRTGDCALIDSRYASEFNYLASMRHLSVHLPCEALERRLQGRRPRLAQAWSGSGAMGGIVGRFVSEIAARHALFGERDGRAMVEALLALLVPLADDVETLGGRARNFARVQAYIEARLGEELEPEAIARACAVSVRSLYRLFEERELTLGLHIRQLRVARCAEALRAPSHRHESVTQIALKWGFKDSAHFSRAFKERYGVAPREWRAAAHLPKPLAAAGK